EKLQKAYQLKSDLLPYQPNIAPQDLEAVWTKRQTYQNYFTNLAKLSFFKTNKTIKKGSFLLESDLSPVQLIRAGDQTEIIFAGSGLEIKTSGISRQNGGIDDDIEIYNPKNK